jgi:hypothetical protein
MRLTPIHMVCVCECVCACVCVRVCVFTQDAMGLTPMHMAAGYCRPSTIKLLVDEGADPEIRTQRNERALDLIRNMRNASQGKCPTRTHVHTERERERERERDCVCGCVCVLSQQHLRIRVLFVCRVSVCVRVCLCLVQVASQNTCPVCVSCVCDECPVCV